MRQLIILLLTFTLPLFAQLNVNDGRSGARDGNSTPRVVPKKTAPVKAQELNILLIGNDTVTRNSFAEVLAYMGQQARKRLTLKLRTYRQPGFSLEQHLQNPALKKELENGTWDCIIIQESRNVALSQPEKFKTNLEPLSKLASSSRKILFMPWTDKVDSGKTKEALEAAQTAADAAGCEVAPAGVAVMRAAASLKNISFYLDDGVNPTPHTSYLAACTLFATLSNQSPIGQRHSGLKSVKAPVSTQLQRLAVQTIADYRKWKAKRK